MDDYTPALPPGFNLKSTSNVSDDTRTRSEDSDSRVGPIGPALPPQMAALAANKSDTEDSSASSSDSSDGDDDGAGGQKGAGEARNTRSIIGPPLPPGGTGSQGGGHSSDYTRSTHDDTSSSDDNEDVIGPKPHTGPKPSSSATLEDIERRAQRMRDKLLNKDTEDAPTKREEWMMVLPEKMKKKVGVNLQAKTSFSRSRCTGEIDPTWTETPQERDEREQAEREGKPVAKKRKHDEEHVPSSRDRQMQEMVTEHNSKTKRGESLLDLHRKKLEKQKKKQKKKEKKARKKAKKEGKIIKAPERIPFDRERDLKTNHFDDAMKKSVLKKAQGVSSRFGTGAQKFL